MGRGVGGVIRRKLGDLRFYTDPPVIFQSSLSKKKLHLPRASFTTLKKITDAQKVHKLQEGYCQIVKIVLIRFGHLNQQKCHFFCSELL